MAEGGALPWEGVRLAVFLTPAINLSVPLLMGLIKYRKLLGLSLSACPCVRGPPHAPLLGCPACPVCSTPSLPRCLSRRVSVAGPTLSRTPAAPKPLPDPGLISPFQFIASLHHGTCFSLPLLWLSLCFPFCPNSLGGSRLITKPGMCASEKPRPLCGTRVLAFGLTCCFSLTIGPYPPPSSLCVARVCLPRSPSPIPPTRQWLTGSSIQLSFSQHPSNTEPGDTAQTVQAPRACHLS